MECNAMHRNKRTNEHRMRMRMRTRMRMRMRMRMRTFELSVANFKFQISTFVFVYCILRFFIVSKKPLHCHAVFHGAVLNHNAPVLYAFHNFVNLNTAWHKT